jgi:hypothetical protein
MHNNKITVIDDNRISLKPRPVGSAYLSRQDIANTLTALSNHTDPDTRRGVLAAAEALGMEVRR